MESTTRSPSRLPAGLRATGTEMAKKHAFGRMNATSIVPTSRPAAPPAAEPLAKTPPRPTGEDDPTEDDRAPTAEPPSPEEPFGKPTTRRRSSRRPAGRSHSVHRKPAACSHDHGHASHGHEGHDHAAAHVAQPPTHLPAESGGLAIQLDLEAMLPGETDDKGRFAELARALARMDNVSVVHLRIDTAWPTICVHHSVNPVGPLLDQLQEVAKRIAHRYRLRTWMVRGMDAAQCATMIEHALDRTTGVLSASVGYAAERLVLEYDTELVTETEIERRIAALGYALEDPPAGHVCAFHGPGGGGAPTLGPWLVGGSGVAIAAGVLLEHFAPALSEGQVGIPTLLYAAALLAAGYYPAKIAFGSLKQLRADIETLTVIAAIGAGLLGAWFEGAFLLFLFSLGHSLEHRAMDRARQAVEALAKLRPDVAWVRREGKVEQVAAADVKVDEIIIVRPGDRVPLDGVIVDGESHLDESAITGESLPRAKAAGDAVYAGAINKDGALEVSVSKAAKDSTLARLVDMVAAAEARKSPDQRMTTQLERRFVPIVLVAAPLLVAGLMVTGASLTDAVLRGLALLVAASPCALAVATPSAVLSAVARAARGGVLIKGGADLHALGKVRAVGFDKTGTLTIGKPKLIEAFPVGGTDLSLLLGTAAGAEALSGHPLAQAVIRGAADRGVAPGQGSDLVAVHGKGIRATVDGAAVALGRADWLPNVLAEALTAVSRMEKLGMTTLVVQRDGQTLGVLGVADTLRPEAMDAIQQLSAMGIDRTVLISGDNNRVARAIAAQVGISEARAPLLPEEKVQALRELARHGGVAMIGDGVNDAPALAAASVGITLGGAGSDVALQTADVVLMGDDLLKLPFAVGLAREANRTVRVNIGIALGVASVLVIASVFGWVGISQAVVLHEGSTLVVVLNGLRLLGWRADRSLS